MAGEIVDNKGRGEADWNWPAIHPEGRKFGVIALAIAASVTFIFDWELIGWPLLALSRRSICVLPPIPNVLCHKTRV